MRLREEPRWDGVLCLFVSQTRSFGRVFFAELDRENEFERGPEPDVWLREEAGGRGEG